MSLVRRAIPPDIPVFHVPCMHFGFSDPEDEYQHNKNLKHYIDEVADMLSTCVRARSSWKKEWCHERAVELRSEALCYATFFGLADPLIEQIPDLDSEAMAKMKAREAKAAAEKAAKTRREQEERRQQAPIAADQWRAGGGHSWLLNSLPAMLRTENHEVVTSRGVRFPIMHAKRGLALVKAVMARAEEWLANGRTCKLGHYRIDRIEASGTVHAGCHVVSWYEIQRIADEIEEYEPRIKCRQCQMLSINGVHVTRQDVPTPTRPGRSKRTTGLNRNHRRLTVSKKTPQKFLVVSYDDDQQQWFWDFVGAKTEQEAVALVCKRRPYVIAADAASLFQ